MDNNYANEFRRTAQIETRGFDYALGCMGLAGESGEVVDLLKKHLFHGKPLDRDALIKELGDVRWYLEYVIQAAGSSMEEVEAANVAKLRKRFPTGFNNEDAARKADKETT